MKNYFKKFSIMFVMLLAIIGFGIIQNGSMVNAATVGQQLMEPESGWKRYDDSDFNIQYKHEFMISGSSDQNYQGCGHKTNMTKSDNQYIYFSFYGSKLRLFDYPCYNASKNSKISFDGGKTFERCSAYGVPSEMYTMFYEKIGLENKIHNVVIEIPVEENTIFGLDFLDTDGYLVPTVSFEKLSMDLTVGDSQQSYVLTSGAYTQEDVVLTSSDESVATIDQNCKVTALKEGKTVITAQYKNSEAKATCVVTVVHKGTNPPVDEPATGDGTLYIEMVDGNIKQAQDLDVADFIKWFKNRDLDDNDNPIYKIKNAKGNVEYLVHDKVVGFEVR